MRLRARNHKYYNLWLKDEASIVMERGLTSFFLFESLRERDKVEKKKILKIIRKTDKAFYNVGLRCAQYMKRTGYRGKE
jgi:hypothetical protein